MFGQPDRAEWLTTVADRWLRIARGVDQRTAAPPARARLATGTKVYERRLPLGDIAGSPLGDLLAYWERQRDARRALPARCHLKVLSIEPLLGRINLIAVHREPPPMRFVWRLHGKDSVLVHGVDRTGKDTSTLQPVYYRELVERHYAECATFGEPTLYEIASAFDRVQQPQHYRPELWSKHTKSGIPAVLVGGGAPWRDSEEGG
jgi:hypothetical protein